MKIALVYATNMEAQAAIGQLEAVPYADEHYKLFSFNVQRISIEGRIIITGMGKERAAAATDYICTTFRPDRVINVGICGALRGSCMKGDIYRVNYVHDGDSLDLSAIDCCNSDLWKNLAALSLITVEKPVMDVDRRGELSAAGDLVDMEGYAIAQTCQGMGISFEMLKGVSDHADSECKEDIKRNIDKVSSALASVLLSGLNRVNKTHKGIILRLMNFIKFEHTVFSLPLIFSGAWIGAGNSMPRLRVLLLVLAAGVGARSLGMAMNRIMDRRLDALNKRTEGRELPSGKITLFQAYSVAATGLAVYMLSCFWLGEICLILSPIPLLFIVSYSLLKRFTCLCHFGIGICMALAPLGAYVAVKGSLQVDLDIFLIALFTFCWIGGYDIIYSLQDMGSDLKNGVHSIPALFGYELSERIAAALHAVAGLSIICIWAIAGAGLYSLTALAVALTALCIGYLQSLPLSVRFFPTSAVAGVAGALIPILGELS